MTNFDSPAAVAQGVLAGRVSIAAGVVFMTVKLVGLRARLARARPGTDFTALAEEAVAIAEAVALVPELVWEAAAIYDLTEAAAMVCEDVHEVAVVEAMERHTRH